MKRMLWVLLTGLVACGLLAYLSVDRRSSKTYQVRVATDATGRPGLTGDPFEGPNAVTLYRPGKNGVTCFDVFQSKDLHERLMEKNGQVVIAEYDTFSDFGKVRGYNVHSVDGIPLADGMHVFRKDYAAKAGVVSSTGSASGDDCWP